MWYGESLRCQGAVVYTPRTNWMKPRLQTKSLAQHSGYAIVPPVNWRISFFSLDLQKEIRDLQAGFVARFLRYAERLEVYGPDLGVPHTRALGRGLFELRLKAVEGIARVFYCTVVERRIVMLHQFIKKSEKTRARNWRSR